ncbi:hypothetical protein NE237_010033 [Protea cynaroides]|uniref:Agenet domain-containing protein n=1 Tax=Protea cynaroides TaxID=273540 RepID=A0A9Q0KYK4_9MAGN|nr:hypothetical protein NE237_010033 [Protea cynaroides]
MAYRVGDSVEVFTQEEGFEGSYYAARVLSVEKKQVLVEYKTLLTDDESSWLREMLHFKRLRPRPPEIRVSEFRLNDEVDAYDNDGWWFGKITKIDESKYYAQFDGTGGGGDGVAEPFSQVTVIDESKYYVHFPCGDEIGYPFSQLRVHQEWKDGRWVSSR